jgi:hypothetical protein
MSVRDEILAVRIALVELPNTSHPQLAEKTGVLGSTIACFIQQQNKL